MKGQKVIVLGVTAVVCLLFSALSGRSFCQTRGPESPEEFRRRVQEQQLKTKQDMEERRRRAEKEHAEWMEQTQKIRADYDDQAWQEALGATPEQWKVIKPRLGKVRNGLSVPFIRISIYSYGGRASYSTKAASHLSGAGGPTAGGDGQPPGAGDAEGARTGIRHFASSTPDEGRAGDSGQPFVGGEPDSNAPGGNRPFGAGGTMGTPGTQSQAFATAGFGISGDVLAKPVKKQVGDLRLGWQWGRPSRHTSYDKLNESTKVCEQLLDVLETKNPDPEQTRQRIEALRKIREQKRAEYQRATQELRAVVTPEQEAKLILMGYLE